ALGELQENTLYTAFAESSPKTLDPAGSYSADETPFTYSIYEPLFRYAYLARPYRLEAGTAVSLVEPRYYDAQGGELPEDAPGDEVAVSVYDIAIKPGIRFQPHPAFAQRGDGSYVYWPMTPEQLAGLERIADFDALGSRELTAHDYVYAFRRLASPRVFSPVYGLMAEHVVGMREYGESLRALDADRPGKGREWLDLREHGFEGVEALDDHTLRIRVIGKYPQFRYWLAMTFTAPIPWEAERFYLQPGMAERGFAMETWPVGTGAYMLEESLRNRRHVLARNPNYRNEPYPCEGEEQDRAAGWLDDCGKPTPFIDRVVMTLEKEGVPLMGKFLQGYYDIPEISRSDYGVAMRVAADDSPEKASLYNERGIQLVNTTEAQVFYLGFNWKDPVVGQGDTPEQQEKNRKLRRALSIAFDWEQYVTIFRNEQAEVAHGPVPPGVLGYQPPDENPNPFLYDVENGRPVRKPLDEARRLLREAGYPDGRNAQTGAPLILYFDATGGMGSSPMLDWMRRQMAALNVQLEVRATDWNRFQDKMRNGTAQMFIMGWVADYPDPENFLFLLYGPHSKADKGGENATNYRNAEYDRLFEQMRYQDDGPEKAETVDRMVRIVQEDAPWMFGFYPMAGGAFQAWVHNAKPSLMVRDMLRYYRLDPEARAASVRRWNAPSWWPLPLLIGVLAVVVAAGAWLVRRRESRPALPGGDKKGGRSS
uniref:ABC transporter substrate-binding protein n=1 Tax=Paracandidimonas soli TaxID=1917182 RepID=UPI003341715B